MATRSVPEWRNESKDAVRYMLLAQWLRMKPAQLPPEQTGAAGRIDEIFTTSQLSWNDLNLVEALLVDFYPEDALDETIATRLGEIRRRGIGDAEAMIARHQAMMVAEPPVSVATRRALLVDSIYAIQHFNLRSAQIRRMRANAIRLVSITSVVALALAVLPLLAAIIHHNAPGSDLDDVIVATVRNFPNYGLYTTVTFGMLGALFSRFVSLQTNYVGIPIDDADVFYRYENIILRIFLGTLAAVIVYFFASSGILAGDIVPNLPELGFEMVRSADGKTELFNVIGDPSAHAIVPTKNFALLVIWAFIAGFSEQLVPDLLSATTTRIGSSRVSTNSSAIAPATGPALPTQPASSGPSGSRAGARQTGPSPDGETEVGMPQAEQPRAGALQGVAAAIAPENDGQVDLANGEKREQASPEIEGEAVDEAVDNGRPVPGPVG